MHKQTISQKVLVFCPPFSGHFNVIKDLIASSTADVEWKVVITGWTNVDIDLDDIATNAIVLARSPLNETDPSLWTFPRVAELLEHCLNVAADFQPDLIIYDFFSLEGKFVGDLMNIPSWSSIPAFIGSFTDKSYLSKKLESENNTRAIETLSTKYGISVKIDDLEMVSDGVHLPAEFNLIWSYKSVTPTDFMTGRHQKSYVFIGNSKELLPRPPSHDRHKKPMIYVSFGTVVMNNLWNQQSELRQNLTSFISALAKLWENNPWDITFVTQGKQILESYPSNWTVVESVNQFSTLGDADVFVTHGGSNSFHESLLTQTPIIVIPFFGDQPLIARNAQSLGIGINLVPDATIDTHSSKAFLNEKLAVSLDTAVQEILRNSRFREKIEKIDFKHDNIHDLIEGKITFHEGDLLFGTNVARKKYVDDNDLQTEFTILEFKAFSELAPHAHSLPRIVDIYHDVILNDVHFSADTQSKLSPYITRLKAYRDYLAGETDFERMCIKGIDFFSKYYKINFILSDYNPVNNPITYAEINHILKNEDRLKHCVTFYKNVNDRWRVIDYSEVRSIQAGK